MTSKEGVRLALKGYEDIFLSAASPYNHADRVKIERELAVARGRLETCALPAECEAVLEQFVRLALGENFLVPDSRVVEETERVIRPDRRPLYRAAFVAAKKSGGAEFPAIAARVLLIGVVALLFLLVVVGLIGVIGVREKGSLRADGAVGVGAAVRWA